MINFDSATIKSDATRDDTAAISSVKVKTIPTPHGDGAEREIKMADKLKALELLGRRLGLFTDDCEWKDTVNTKLDDIKLSVNGTGTELAKIDAALSGAWGTPDRRGELRKAGTSPHRRNRR